MKTNRVACHSPGEIFPVVDCCRGWTTNLNNNQNEKCWNCDKQDFLNRYTIRTKKTREGSFVLGAFCCVSCRNGFFERDSTLNDQNPEDQSRHDVECGLTTKLPAVCFGAPSHS